MIFAEEAEAKLAGRNGLVTNGSRPRAISALGTNSEVHCLIAVRLPEYLYLLQYSSPPNEPAFPRLVHSASDLEALSAASSPSVSRGPWTPVEPSDPTELIPAELLHEL